MRANYIILAVYHLDTGKVVRLKECPLALARGRDIRPQNILVNKRG